MKTIEEEAKEYASKVAGVVVPGTVITYTIEELNSFSESDFKSGVEFAQRWIPVEEELPPIGIEVIVKERFNEHEIYAFNSTRDRLIKCQDNCITHWRPIEIK